MYISRVPIEASDLRSLRLVGSPYRMHAAIERCFGEDAVREGEEGRILWRLDDRGGDASWLYVVSPEAPDLGVIAGQCRVTPGVPYESKDYAPVLGMLAEGQAWQFRLKANPCHRVGHDRVRDARHDVSGTIQGHVTVEQQEAWLLERCGRHGFDVVHDMDGNAVMRVSQRRRERFRRGDATVTIATAVFDGVCVVTDAALMRQTLGFGIGRAKGFGCGLMTIAPVNA